MHFLGVRFSIFIATRCTGRTGCADTRKSDQNRTVWNCEGRKGEEKTVAIVFFEPFAEELLVGPVPAIAVTDLAARAMVVIINCDTFYAVPRWGQAKCCSYFNHTFRGETEDADGRQ
jgi:hypothetical protein